VTCTMKQVYHIQDIFIYRWSGSTKPNKRIPKVRHCTNGGSTQVFHFWICVRSCKMGELASSDQSQSISLAVWKSAQLLQPKEEGKPTKKEVKQLTMGMHRSLRWSISVPDHESTSRSDQFVSIILNECNTDVFLKYEKASVISFQIKPWLF